MPEHPLLDVVQTILGTDASQIENVLQNRGPLLRVGALGAVVARSFRLMPDSDERLKTFDSWVALLRKEISEV